MTFAVAAPQFNTKTPSGKAFISRVVGNTMVAELVTPGFTVMIAVTQNQSNRRLAIVADAPAVRSIVIDMFEPSWPCRQRRDDIT